MRSVSKVALVLGLAFLLTVPAAAQQRQRGQGRGGRGGFGGFGGVGQLLSNEGVQKELKLDAGQVEKATAAVQKVREKHQDEMTKLREEGPDARDKMMALNQTISTETMKELDTILKPDQIKRLKQLQLQQRGVQAFADPEVEKALKLTNEQKEKVKTIASDSQTQMRELFQPGGGADFQEMAKKRAALQKESMDRIASVLTAEQKQTWKDLVGQPFEFQFQQGRRRGGQ